jgi:hypothetical protein
MDPCILSSSSKSSFARAYYRQTGGTLCRQGSDELSAGEVISVIAVSM